MKKVRFIENIMLLMSFALTTSCDEIDDLFDGGNDVDIESGLMAYYTFDNGTAEDITDNGLDGTLLNSPLFVTGTANGSGKAVFFNSLKEQYMNIPYNPWENISNYAATMWVKDFGYGSFLKIESDSNTPYFDFYYDEDGLFKIRIYNGYGGEGTFTYSAKSLIDGNWHMIAITRAVNLCELYVDGILVANKEISNYTTPDAPSIVVDNHMYFDNLRLYNRAISAKEVKAIYNKEK